MRKKNYFLSSIFLFLMFFLGNISQINAAAVGGGTEAGWPENMTITNSVTAGGSANFSIGSPSGAALTSFLNTYGCTRYRNGPTTPSDGAGYATQKNCSFAFNARVELPMVNTTYFTVTPTNVNHNTYFNIATSSSTPAGSYSFSVNGNVLTWGTGSLPQLETSYPVTFDLTVAVPVPSVSLTADSTSITTSASTTLRWNSVYATSCTGVGTGTSGTAPYSNSTPGTYTITETCVGSGGQRTASVNITVTPAPTCGTSNGGNFYTAPTTNLCASGTASSVTGTGPWNWSCTSGSSVSCSANKKIDGVCSSTRFACSVGTSINNVTSGVNSTWSCQGINTGNTVSCGPQVMSGTLSVNSYSCVIPLNSNKCPITFTWNTVNPQGTSMVTTPWLPATTIVGNGNSGSSTGYATFSSQNFFLYNNANILDQVNISTSCATNTTWDGSKCAATTYPVTGSAGSNGTISPSLRSVAYGSSTTFTVTPNTGYTASASGCGGSLSGTTYTTGAITSACTVSATFAVGICSAPTTQNVSVACDPIANYSVTGSVTRSQTKSAYPSCSFPALPVTVSNSTYVSDTCVYTPLACSAPLTRNVTVACDLNTYGDSAISGEVTRSQTKSAYPSCSFPALPITVSNSTYVSDNCVYPTPACSSPLTETQTLSCDEGYSGSITQTRTKSAYPSCTWGAWNTTSDTCTFVVLSPTATLTANPSTIVKGASTVLTWSSTNATSCSAMGFATDGATSGSVTLSPTVTTTYNLICFGTSASATDSKTVTITVTPGKKKPTFIEN